MFPTALPQFNRRRLAYWLVVVGILICFAAVRWRLREMPLERDEGEYAYAGSLLLQGVPPYQMAFNMKFPGTYLAYALLMSLLGETVAGIHVGLILVVSLSTLLVFLVGRRLVDASAGVGAAWVFAFLSANQSLFGLAGHATHFVVLFHLTSVWQMLAWTERGGAWRVLAAGSLSGIAILMKQHAVFLSGICLALVWLRGGETAKSLATVGRIKLTALFAAGSATPLALLGIWLAIAGVFDKFLFWTVTYARHYVGNIPLSLAPVTFAEMASDVCLPSAGLWLCGFVGVGLGLASRTRRQPTWILAIWGLSGFIAICPGFVFREHYFLLLVPPVALLSGLAVSDTLNRLRQSGETQLHGLLLACGLAVAQVLAFNANWEVWLTGTPAQASRRIYANQGFVEAGEVARFIRTNSSATARIAVLGSEPQIMFLSQRRSVTGLLYTYPLMEPQPFAHRLQSDLIRDVETASPEFVVFAHHPNSWLIRPDSDRTLFEWWQRFQPEHYEMVGFADILPDGTTSCWDKVEQCPRPSPNGFTVYRLKALVVEVPRGMK